MVFKVLIILSILKLTLAVNSIGNACNSDSDCSGINEYCESSSYLTSPSCSSGTCKCLHCYTTGDFTGYDPHPQNPCVAVKPRWVGDTCEGHYSELIVSPNAICSNYRVVCEEGYIKDPTTSICIRSNGGIMENGLCSTNIECAGNMICRTGSNTCGCSSGSTKYDVKTAKCIPREFGDVCSQDSDCRVYGSLWQGFTYSFGACIGGKCGCATGAKKTSVSYIDTPTGLVKTKTICVNSAGYVDRLNGTDCTKDPIADSEYSSVGVCFSGFVCSKCGGENSRYCRKVVDRAPWGEQGCFTPPIVPLPVKSWMAGWSEKDKMIAQVVNMTWPNYNKLRQCYRNDNCLSNEECWMPTQCGRGFCTCPAPKHWDGVNCLMPTTSTSTSTTTTTTTSTTTTTTTSTTTTTTTSTTTTPTTTTSGTTTTSTSTTSTTTTTPAGMYYYSKCDQDSDCLRVGEGIANAKLPNGLICMNNGTGEQKYCLCGGDNLMWDISVQQCRYRDFGDPCIRDSDCNNHLYVKNSAGGHACLTNGKCGCSSTYRAVEAAALMAPWGATVPSYVQQPEYNRTYCVLYSKYIGDIAVNNNCTLNVFDQTDGKTRICQKGMVCLGCPLDKTVQEEKLGTCVQFSKFRRFYFLISCKTLIFHILEYPVPPQDSTGGSGTGSKSKSNSAISLQFTSIRFFTLLAFIHFYFA